MRAFVVVAVVALCAAVAYGDLGRFHYPYELVEAWTYLPYRTFLGHFRAQVQVPPEPKEQSDQTIIYFMGALGNETIEEREMVKTGLALIWTAKDHWVATLGSVNCETGVTNCDFTPLPKTELSVEPGDLVFLNITDLPKKYVVGYEISVPFKGLSTGTVTWYTLGEREILGVFAAISEINLKSLDQFPRGETKMLKIAYSANVSPDKELPLTWKSPYPSKFDQKFVQQNDWLILNWQ